jgi:hypothetical protein
MGVIGDMGRFQQYQMGQAMTAAAANPAGGGAADGMGLGMGFAMAQQIAQGAGGGGAAAVPPPLPAAAVWHVAAGGSASGPFGMAQLHAEVQAGRLTPATLVWTAGMSGWEPAGQLAALAALFGPPSPPPLPGS